MSAMSNPALLTQPSSSVSRDRSNVKNSGWTEGFTMEEVESNHKDFSWVVSKVKNTGNTFRVKKVFRIKNSATWNAYVATRAKIFAEMGSKDLVPEKRLFHGSPWSMQIAEQGFKLSYAKNGSFGVGVYFSNQSTESYSYSCKIGAQTTKYMLVCRVALGVTSQGAALTAGTHSIISGSRHVIYNESQAYPSFLIEI